MSKKLIISEEEKKRILELHESSTNNKNLINEDTATDIAARIHKASYGPGTGLDFLYAIQAITNLEELKKIDYLLKKGYSKLGLEGQINDEFDAQEDSDKKSLSLMKSHLEKIGANMIVDKNSSSIKIEYNSQNTQNTQNTQNPQNPTQLSADDAALKDCVDYVLKKMEYSRDSFAQIYNSDPNNDKQLAQNLITTYNEQPSKKTSFSPECLATFKYSLGINDEEKKTSEKTNQKPIIKQPLVNQYIEKIKTDLQLPKNTTQQDTLNALMAKLNEIPVRK